MTRCKRLKRSKGLSVESRHLAASRRKATHTLEVLLEVAQTGVLDKLVVFLLLGCLGVVLDIGAGRGDAVGAKVERVAAGRCKRPSVLVLVEGRGRSEQGGRRRSV